MVLFNSSFLFFNKVNCLSLSLINSFSFSNSFSKFFSFWDFFISFWAWVCAWLIKAWILFIGIICINWFFIMIDSFLSISFICSKSSGNSKVYIFFPLLFRIKIKPVNFSFFEGILGSKFSIIISLNLLFFLFIFFFVFVKNLKS